MKTKLVVGSIIAVVILILLSFTSVVGFQSVKSDSKIASPLFRIRNQKGEITSNYIRKGDTVGIYFPAEKSKIASVQGVIVKIRNMNDDENNKFIDYIHNNFYSKSIIEEREFNNLVILLEKIRNNPYEFMSNVQLDNEGFFTTLAMSKYALYKELFVGILLSIILLIIIFIAFYAYLLKQISISFSETCMCKQCMTL